jgi:hypothetical protein
MLPLLISEISRFAWKRLPVAEKKKSKEVVAVWAVSLRLIHSLSVRHVM